MRQLVWLRLKVDLPFQLFRLGSGTSQQVVINLVQWTVTQAAHQEMKRVEELYRRQEFVCMNP